jgi:hypothetical protein
VTGRGQVWSFAGVVALMAVATVVYTSALYTSPPYLMHDELQFSLQSTTWPAAGFRCFSPSRNFHRDEIP